MSDWIESHAALRDHPKLKRLSRRLGITRREATGLLHWLWWWAMDYAPDGDLGDYSAEDIADGLDWEGDPEALLEALRHAGFLDGSILHDWEDYGGKLHWRKKANAERMRAARAVDKEHTSNERAAHVQRTCEKSAEPEDLQDKEDLQKRTERTKRTNHRACAREEAVDNSIGKELATWSREHVPGWKATDGDPAFFAGLMPPWSEVQVRTALATVADQGGKKAIRDPRAYLRSALERTYPAQPPPPSTIPKDVPEPTPVDVEEAKRIIGEAAAKFRTIEGGPPDDFADIDFGEEPAGVGKAVSA